MKDPEEGNRMAEQRSKRGKRPEGLPEVYGPLHEGFFRLGKQKDDDELLELYLDLERQVTTEPDLLDEPMSYGNVEDLPHVPVRRAFILAGGEGSRLRPLTWNRPKPLLPIVNKPIMQHVLELLVRHGFTDIIAGLYYMADEIQTFFGDGSGFGVQMRHVVEEVPLGTAGSVKLGEQWLRDGTFLVISGDVLTDFDLTDAILFHKRQGCMATVVLARCEIPRDRDMVITNADGRIQRFLEKSDCNQALSGTINTGIYILDPEILDYIKPDVSCDWTKDIFPILLQQGQPLFGYTAQGYWCDVGSIHTYRQAHYDVLGGRLELTIPGERREGGIWVHPTAKIEEGAKIAGPVVVGSHAIVRRGASIRELSVLGDSCIAESDTEIDGSIVWNGAYIGAGVHMSGAVIGCNARIDRGSTLEEGVVIADRTHVQRSSWIRSHVKVWPDKTIEAEARVTESLIWGPRYPRTLFSEGGVSGLANIEMTPEFAAKLAAAYGFYLGWGASVVVSGDAHPASNMIQLALAVGLMSAGMQVQYLSSIPVPVSRFLLMESDARGGVHVRISPSDPREITVEFCNGRGALLDKNAESIVENFFFREDFVRADFLGVRPLEHVPWTAEQYTERLASLVHQKACQEARFHVMLDCAYGSTCRVLPSVLEDLGCSLVTLNGFVRPREEPRTPEEKNRSLLEMGSLVTAVKAEMGLVISGDGESLHVIDHTGRPIPDSLILSVMCLLAFASGDARTLAVPVSAPSVIEKIAARYGGRVLRTKTDPAALMALAVAAPENLAFVGDTNGRFIFPRFHPAFDAMMASAKLMEYLVLSERRRVADVAALLPRYHWYPADVACPREKRGEIMRRLVEDMGTTHVDFTDGVKLTTDRGWVLVTPDAREPNLCIRVEGRSQEDAMELLADIREKIDGYVHEQ